MNILEQQSAFTKALGRKVADLQDSSAYAYIMAQVDYLRMKGEDLTEYEVIIAQDEYPKVYQNIDGTNLRITQHIKIIKSSEIKNLGAK